MFGFSKMILGAINGASSFLQKLLQERVSNQPGFSEDLELIKTFHEELNEGNPLNQLSAQRAYELKQKYSPLYQRLHRQRRLVNYPDIEQFFRAYTSIDSKREQLNKGLKALRKIQAKELLDNIDGNSLDEQQRDAVVSEEDNCLVIAGAGSGKTLTIAAKVAYLVKVLGVRPEQILLITFTAKAAKEMEERVVERLGIPVEVRTFHGLGNEIIAKVKEAKPSVQEQNQYIINQFFEKVVFESPSTVREILSFFGQYFYFPPDPATFQDIGQYYGSIKSLELRTLKDICEEHGQEKVTLQGEQVKSLQELMIANFLYLNGIEYVYEKPYEYSTADRNHRQYQPDFYLPQAKLYIEHFGINKQGRAAWLSEIEDKKYQEGIKWKRSIHQQHGTELYETYSYQFNEGNILEILEKDLKARGIEFKEVSLKETYTKILHRDKKHFKELKKLMWTFLNLYKSQGGNLKGIKELEGKASKESNPYLRKRMKSFIYIFKGLFSYYESYLKETQTIDFNDMISEAAHYIRNDEVKLNYHTIIIDEYQDIAFSRYEMIKLIKEKCGAKLMAVGDDWQSIYRFAGSDLSLFTSFEKMFGLGECLMLEKTYRNSQELIELAGKFVMKNPLQIQKHLKSERSIQSPVQLIGYSKEIQKAFLYALGKIHKEGISKEIMVIGRNNYDVESLYGSEHLRIYKKGEEIWIDAIDYPDLKIKFCTAHKSKGLEAEEVILINCRNELLGFPNQIVDDPILDLVMTEEDYYAYGEERRLFYVALTRTKRRCYLMVPQQRPSIFVEELIKNHHLPLYQIEEDKIINRKAICPVCESGMLILRTKNNRSFLGCTNYPYCQFTSRNIEILKDPIRCNQCGGYMVKRKGAKGTFYGCSNYPECKNTIQHLEKH